MFWRLKKALYQPFLPIIGAVTRVETQKPLVALTFDDGPNPDYTPKLLKILARHGAQATFFMVGRYAEKYPDIVNEVLRGGHSIGNHSWDHPSFPLIGSGDRRRQLTRTESVLPPRTLKIFRPPFGHFDWRSGIDVSMLGYTVIGWSISGNDWKDDSPEQISQRVTNNLHPGAIILLHDHLTRYSEKEYLPRNSTLESVDLLLDIHKKNYKFLTIDKLFEEGKIKREKMNIKTIKVKNSIDLLNL